MWRAGRMGGVGKPPAIKAFSGRNPATALVAVVSLLVLQLAASIALYGARANNLFLLWLPPVVTVLAMSVVLSGCLSLKKPLALFVAAALSAITWMVALTIAINK